MSLGAARARPISLLGLSPPRIRWPNISGTFPTDLGTLPLRAKILLESSPLKSIIGVRRSAALPPLKATPPLRAPRLWPGSSLLRDGRFQKQGTAQMLSHRGDLSKGSRCRGAGRRTLPASSRGGLPYLSYQDLGVLGFDSRLGLTYLSREGNQLSISLK